MKETKTKTKFFFFCKEKGRAVSRRGSIPRIFFSVAFFTAVEEFSGVGGDVG